MTATELTITALIVESILYLLAIVVALRRGSLRENAVRAFVLYATVSGLWTLGQLAGQLDWFTTLGVDLPVLAQVSFYGLGFLATLFLYLTHCFLRLPGTGWGWLALGITWFVGLILLDSNVLALPDLLWNASEWSIDRAQFISGAAFAGWGLFMGASAWLTIKTYRQTELPLHRNRLKYWPLTWGITLGGALLFLAGHELVGGGIHLLGALVAAYIVFTHRLPDVRQIARHTVSYLLAVLVTLTLYIAGFMAAQYMFQGMPGYNPLWVGAVMVLILAILFTPLLGLIQKLVNRLIRGASYDPSRTVSEYSLQVSNIVSLERLAAVVVALISDTLEIRHGSLFVVHYQQDEDGTKTYQLRGIGGVAEEAPPSGALSTTSPVTYCLREERRPLTQYDIDLLPDFQDLAKAERAWLSSLGMDVYVPIHSQGSWIGLLALGPKASGDRYFNDDLVLLNTLADQTAVALENARLVDDLLQLNADLTEAYEALARANHQLQEMDKLKSAFIGVITHELRSPFANIAFSLQLFKRYGVENLNAEQHKQLDQLTDSLKHAKAMVDNLVTFATFLSKQGDLNLAQLDFGEMLQETLAPLKPMAENKDLTLYTTIPEELPLLYGDRERLSDAMHHLIHNAIKFTESDGEVWIQLQAQDDTIHFEVKDTGTGIPADKLPTLWEGFAQMADPLQRGVEGLGLGLALVKYIVGAHGGEVWAESKEGSGSTFGFQLPVAGPDSFAPVLGVTTTSPRP